MNGASPKLYQQLLVEPQHLAFCRAALTVPQLLRNLKALWQCEKASDEEVVSYLSWCNQQITDISPAQLGQNWIPYRYDNAKRNIHWCLPDGRPTEPFHDEYVSRCRQHSVVNQLFQPKTPLQSLASLHGGGDQPAGFIFHVSRCGSTLLSGCLSELNNTHVLSESQLLTDILLDSAMGAEEKARVLPLLVHLQSLSAEGNKTIIKWNAWDVFHWPLLRKLYPQVPVVLLIRHPLEVLASHERSPGRHMGGDKKLRFLDAAFSGPSEGESIAAYRARVLVALMAQMALTADDPKVKVVDYSRLSYASITRISNYFEASASDKNWSCVRERMTFHSKETGRRFSGDAGGMSVPEQGKIWQQLTVVYGKLRRKCDAEINRCAAAGRLPAEIHTDDINIINC